jgi:hypothetical protein
MDGYAALADTLCFNVTIYDMSTRNAFSISFLLGCEFMQQHHRCRLVFFTFCFVVVVVVFVPTWYENLVTRPILFVLVLQY